MRIKHVALAALWLAFCAEAATVVDCTTGSCHEVLSEEQQRGRAVKGARLTPSTQGGMAVSTRSVRKNDSTRIVIENGHSRTCHRDAEGKERCGAPSVKSEQHQQRDAEDDAVDHE